MPPTKRSETAPHIFIIYQFYFVRKWNEVCFEGLEVSRLDSLILRCCRGKPCNSVFVFCPVVFGQGILPLSLPGCAVVETKQERSLPYGNTGKRFLSGRGGRQNICRYTLCHPRGNRTNAAKRLIHTGAHLFREHLRKNFIPSTYQKEGALVHRSERLFS